MHSAQRAEAIIKTIIPASLSGMLAAIILGVMRRLRNYGGLDGLSNSAKIPEPWYMPWNLFAP